MRPVVDRKTQVSEMGKCIECTYSVPDSGSRVNCAVLTKRISDGDRERDCPYFYPRILT